MTVSATTIGLVIVFATFVALLSVSLWSRKGRKTLAARSTQDWLVDGLSLLMQGFVIPLAQAVLLATLWRKLCPDWTGLIRIPAFFAFILSFTLVDYLYYWNHRWLHTKNLWPWHRLHHSPRELDFLVTARNSLFTPFLIVYVWINSWLIFSLEDATGFIIGTSVSAALDLWRHSGFEVTPHSLWYRALNRWMIIPNDHRRHHSLEMSGINFGANLNLWDRLHGTFYRASETESQIQYELGLIENMPSAIASFINPYASESGSTSTVREEAI